MKPKKNRKKRKKVLTFQKAKKLLKGKPKNLNGLESKVFPIAKQT